MTDDLSLAGESRAGGRVMKAPDQPRGSNQGRVVEAGIEIVGNLTCEMAEYLAVLFVDPEVSRRNLEIQVGETLQQRPNELAVRLRRPPHRLGDADHALRNPTAAERNLAHAPKFLSRLLRPRVSRGRVGASHEFGCLARTDPRPTGARRLRRRGRVGRDVPTPGAVAPRRSPRPCRAGRSRAYPVSPASRTARRSSRRARA